MSINDESDLIKDLAIDDPLPAEWYEMRRKKRERLRELLWSKVEAADFALDVPAWKRALRKFMCFCPNDIPATIPVSYAMHAKLAEELRTLYENLGSDIVNHGGMMVFHRIPIEARPS